MAEGADFDRLWSELDPIGRRTATGGYARFAWTREDATLREWFISEAQATGLDVVPDRNGNLFAWWGDPDQRPGVVVGSHLDSVPDGGAYDGPLGVVSALLAVRRLRETGVTPRYPIGVACFADEEGARFGVACAGSRLLTGAMTAGRALALRDSDGTSMAEALSAAGLRADHVGRDDTALRRIGCFVELHVEQGRGLVDLGRPIAVASAIWPHGRWRFDIDGEANHAGTTPLSDRRDAMLGYADTVLAVRRLAEQHGVVATCGKVRVEPGGVNAIAARVTGWLDARGPRADDVRRFIDDLREVAPLADGSPAEESWTDETRFDPDFTSRVASSIGEGVPVLATGAGHDAGVLATACVPSAMVFVRNPTGVSHSPLEHAEREDCLAGVNALSAVVRELAG